MRPTRTGETDRDLERARGRLAPDVAGARREALERHAHALERAPGLPHRAQRAIERGVGQSLTLQQTTIFEHPQIGQWFRR